jgi:hypothetical protein
MKNPLEVRCTNVILSNIAFSHGLVNRDFKSTLPLPSANISFSVIKQL